jgi:AmmeMemoRadiSam system protein B/AmmeMemoRadiSam system protein A
MKPAKNTFGFFLLTFMLTLFIAYPAAFARPESVRPAVWAGRFYKADPSGLAGDIDRLTRKALKTRLQFPANKSLRAIVMPHAGYIYSGWTAAHAIQVLSSGQYSKVILIGPDHRIGIKSAAICNASAYETPLGVVNFHKDVEKLRRQRNLFQSIPIERDLEHSLEVILPFLQRYLGKFQLVPVIVGFGDARHLANAVNSIFNHDTLLVVSSDLSHYLPYAEAAARDRETLNAILNLKSDILIGSDNRACGKLPLIILTEIARRHHWQPVLLHYSNSGDTAGNHSRVVGYAAIAYFGDQAMTENDNSKSQFSESQGRVLVNFARQTIVDKLGGDIPESTSEDLKTVLQDKQFKLNCGTFVTLKIKDRLRGCIGNLTSTETVLEGVKRNALNAAFHDPRFSPLSKDELEQTEIEVSILSEPQQLAYRDGQDLVNKLRAHIDGVIIRKGHRSATFLPQVWEQLPKHEDFLTHLCRKAGLPSDAWQKAEMEVLTYQVQYFEENQ